MGNLNTCLNQGQKADSRSALKEMGKDLEAIYQMFQSSRVQHCVMKMKTPIFIRFAMENCRDEAAQRWLRENLDSFSQLADVFLFLKKRLNEEENKNHSNHIHIVLVCHGETRESTIPASCLLPLYNITDVVLDSPWISCKSVKKAGNQMIPNIVLKPPEDAFCSDPPRRNRIPIPLLLSGQSSHGVPLPVVTLALSLALLSSGLTATLHLDACRTDASAGWMLNRDCATSCCSAGDTEVLGSAHMWTRNWTGVLKRFMAKCGANLCL